MIKRYIFLAFLLFFSFFAIVLNIFYLHREFSQFYASLIQEEVLRVKSIVEGTIAGGGDPIEALSSYIESSPFLKGACFKLSGREIIVPGSDISKNYLKKTFKIPPFTFILYFDLSQVREVNRHLLNIFLSLLFFVFLFIFLFFIVMREYFNKKILYEREKQEKEKLESINLVIHSLLHEVKNKLNTLKLLVYRIQQSSPSEYAKLLQKEVDSLGRYLEETAELRRPIVLKKEQAEIKQVVEETLKRISEVITAKKIKLFAEVEKCSFKFDREKVSSLLLDLLKNAVEAVESVDSPVIKIKGRKEKGRYVLEVEDSGGRLPNIDIFKPFSSTKEKGFGLGLYNAKRIVEAHGGQIKAFVRNNYTVFEIVFPL